MAPITRFLKPEVQSRIRKDEERFEKTFKLPTGTVERVSQAKAGRKRPRISSTREQVSSIDTAPSTQSVQQQIKEQSRIERAASGKISGQLSSRDEQGIPEGSISAFKPQDFSFESGFRRSPAEATKSFVTKEIPEFVSGLGSALGGVLVGDTRRLREIDPFVAFKDVGRKEGEKQIVSTVPQFGTVTPQSTGGFITTRETEFERIAQARIQAGVPLELSRAPISAITQQIGEQSAEQVRSGVQSRIDAGEITLEQGQKEAQQQFEDIFQTKTRPLTALGGEDLLRRTGERVSSGVKSFIPAAGLTALSLTPGGAVVGGSLSVAGGGFLASRGRQRIREGDITGGVLDIGSGALFAAGGFAGIGSAAGRVEQQILASRVQRLGAQPTVFRGQEVFKSGDDSILFVESGRRVGDFASQRTAGFIPIVRTGTTQGGQAQFSAIGGRGGTRTFVRGLPITQFQGISQAPRQITFSDLSTFSLTARGQQSSGSTFFSQPNIGTRLSPSEFQGATGRVDVVIDQKRFTSGFGSVTKASDDAFTILGGKPQKLLFDGGFKARTDVSTAGIIKRLTGTGGGSGLGTGSGSQVFSLGGTSSGITSNIGGGSAGQLSSALGGSASASSASSSFASTAFGGSASRRGLDLVASNVLATPRVVPISSSAPPVFNFQTPSITTAPSPQFRLSRSDTTTQLVSQQQFTSGFTTFDTGFKPLDFKTSFSGGNVPVVSQRPGQGTRQRNNQIVSPVTDVIQSPATGQRNRQVQLVEGVQETRQSFKPVQPTLLPPTLIQAPGFSPRLGGFSGLGAFGGLPAFGAFQGFKLPTQRSANVGQRVSPSLTGIALFDIGDITGGDLNIGSFPSLRLVPGSQVRRRKKKKR